MSGIPQCPGSGAANHRSAAAKHPPRWPAWAWALCLSAMLLFGWCGWQWLKPRPDHIFKEKNSLQSALEKVEQLANSPETKGIVLTPFEVNCLTGDYRVNTLFRHQFSFGVICTEKPVQVKMDAVEYAWRLRAIGDAITVETRESTALELKMFRGEVVPAQLLSEGAVDFMVLDAISWLEVRALMPDVTLVARADGDSRGILFTHERTGLHSVGQLRNTRIVFPDPHFPINPLAKALLADAGIRAGNLLNCVTYSDHDGGLPSGGKLVISQRETIIRVESGEFDAGVAAQRHLKAMNLPGLVTLASFSDAPSVVVARAQLSPQKLQTFRKALLSLAQRSPPRGMPDSVKLAYVVAHEADFENLRDIVRKAHEFDGSESVKSDTKIRF
jgi:hypothetical protein